MTFEPAYDALILHMNHQQTLGCFYTCLCASASSLLFTMKSPDTVFLDSFLGTLACSGSVDYVSCVIGSEISAEANDSVGGGLII